MHHPQGLSNAVTMQAAPVPSNFLPTDVPSGRRCGSTKSGTIVAGRYSSNSADLAEKRKRKKTPELVRGYIPAIKDQKLENGPSESYLGGLDIL